MELSDIKNLKNMLDFAAENYPENEFMLYKENGGLAHKTYAQFKTASDAFSRMIEQKGYKGSHVAVVGPTCFEWVCTYFGTVDSGSVIIPLTSNETDEMNIDLIKFGDATVFVFDKKHINLYEKLRSELPQVTLFISLDDCCTDKDVLSFSDIIKDYSGEYVNNPDDSVMCTLLFTSGTTGFPKGVMLTHKNLVNTSMSYNEACHAKRVLTCLPISHAFCFTTNFLKIIFRGATVCVNDAMPNLLADIRLFSPNSIVVVPQIVHRLMGGALKFASTRKDITEQQAVAEFLGHSDKIISGGAPLDAALNHRYTAAGMPVLNGYGMSECSPIIANNAPIDHRDGSVGKPIPCNKVKIENGEILVKGAGVMLGYYKNEEATKAAFTEDGWLHTGDLGHFDDDGYLYITGRSKNLILLDNGENVSAEYIELKFGMEPLVQEIVAFGDDGVICVEIYPNGEYVKQQGIIDIDREITALLGRVNASLATHQRISKYFIRETPFERTASSKIKRTGTKPAERTVKIAPQTPAEIRVCRAVCDILAKSEVGVNESFFALGGDSLTATELAVDLHISVQTLYDNPFLGSLAKLLGNDEKRDDDYRENINDIINETAGADRFSGSCNCVLLTGATGFLGIHILKELLDRNLSVVCLVRNSEKLLSQLDFYFKGIDTSKITTYCGNIESDHLGLSEEDYEHLSEITDAVFHVAANVHHAGDYSELKKTNVEGTKNIIAFAKRANAVLHHTSTVSVHGAATVVETQKKAVFDEFTLDIGQHFADNVYIHSKYRAEEAVILARQDGLLTNIYRIGNLTWRSSDGKFQINNGDNGFLHRIRAMLKLGLVSDNSDKYPMDLTPVDECAKAFVSLALSGRVNEIYHLYNPSYLRTEDLFKALEVPFRRVSTLEMLETILSNTDDRDIHVFMFYMLISSRSANIETLSDFTFGRLNQVGFCWSKPDSRYLHLGSDDTAEKGHCLTLGKYDIKPMKNTGGYTNPIQNVAVGALRNTVIPNQKLFEGITALASLKEYIIMRLLKKPLFITYGHALENASLSDFIKSFDGVLFNRVGGEPTLSVVGDCTDLYAENSCDCVVAIGGGSVLDCAKLVALCAGNPGKEPDEICGFTAKPDDAVPFFAVPTTAGTGSEVTLFSVVTDEKEHKKVAHLSDRFLPQAVVLDSSLTLAVSAKTTANTGIDALSHAVEAYVSLYGNSFPEDRSFAPKACATIFENLPACVKNPNDATARQNMLKASYEAGISFRRISTGYIHAVAHRLGEMFELPHGECIACAFVPILKAYLPYASKELADLAMFCGFVSDSESLYSAADRFIEAVDSLINEVMIKPKLNISDDDIEEIVLRAQDEAKSVGYPRPFSDKQLAEIITNL